MFFSVGLLIKLEHSKSSKDEPLWEYRVVLVEATSEDEAKQKGEVIGKNYEETYEAQKGDMVTWKFVQVECVCMIEDEKLKDGTELFSRFLRDSEVQSILTPFDD